MFIRVLCCCVVLIVACDGFTKQILSAEVLPVETRSQFVTATPLVAPLPRDAFDNITAGNIQPHVEYLASPELCGRRGMGAWLAAEYIAKQFKSLGLKPLFEADGYFQSIPGAVDQPNGQRSIIGRNIGAWLPGSDPSVSDEFIIVSAHYDHLGELNGEIYPGADDNASGVAMMLEVARQLAKLPAPPRRSIVFVGFDLEEQLLWGSRWFANHPPWPLTQVKLFITADMVGRTLGDLPLPVVFVLGSESATQLKASLDRSTVPNGIEVARMGIDLIGTRSDYGPFRDRQVPFLFFSGGEHPDYHTPRDVPERVDYERVAKVAALVGRVVTDVAEIEESPIWNSTIDVDIDEARSLNRISTLLLNHKGKKSLGTMQRAIVTHAKSKTGQIIRRGSMTAIERKWLIRLSQVMLFSVF